MKEILEFIYIENFQKIYKWFYDNIHESPNEHEYSIVSLPFSNIKLVDIIHNEQPSYAFRVILKATYDVPPKNLKLPKSKDHMEMFSTNLSTMQYSFQTCFVHLDKNNNPVNGFLFSLNDLSEKFYHSMF